MCGNFRIIITPEQLNASKGASADAIRQKKPYISSIPAFQFILFICVILVLLPGHGLRFRTKAEKQRAEKENEKVDSSAGGTDKEKNGSSLLPPAGQSGAQQDRGETLHAL